MNPIASDGSPRLARLAINHGPADLLGRFFRQADTAPQPPVTLSFADMAEPIEINALEPRQLIAAVSQL
jgi:hypothetical protein